MFDGFLKELTFGAVYFFFFFSFFYAKGVLKRRDQIQGELDSKVDALANKKTEKDLVSIFRKLDSSRPYCNSRRCGEGPVPSEATCWGWCCLHTSGGPLCQAKPSWEKQHFSSWSWWATPGLCQHRLHHSFLLAFLFASTLRVKRK